MSIATYRENMRGIPGSDRIVMRYEDGGKVQVYKIDETEVRVGPMASYEEVKAAFQKAFGA